MPRHASLLPCLFLLLVPRVDARIWWVATSSVSQTRLGTAEYPLVGVQTGLDSAASGDTVLLTEGSYAGSGYVNRGKGGIVLGSLLLIDGDTSHVWRTSLDGGNDDTTALGAGAPILTLTLSDSASFRIEGLVFARGAAERGGAVRIVPATADAPAGCVFVRAHFSSNKAAYGGAVHGGMNVFRSCAFYSNWAAKGDGQGGGAYAADPDLRAPRGSTWDSCVFGGNEGGSGGAIQEWKRCTIRNSYFSGCYARGAGSRGGVVANLGPDTTILERTKAIGNGASGAGATGGALYTRHARIVDSDLTGIYSPTAASVRGSGSGIVVAIGTKFLANITESGPAFAGVDLDATRCSFESNGSQHDGDGGVHGGGRFTARRCLFENNRAGGRGGVVASDTARFEECAFFGNRATQGAIASASSIEFVNSSAQGCGCSASDLDQSTTRAEGSLLATRVLGGSLGLRWSVFQGTRAASTFETSWSHDYRLDVDPGFLNPLAGDLRLLPASPGVDGGDPALDASLEPPCSGHAARRDLGYHGNTAQATCPDEILGTVSFEPARVARTLRRGEYLVDSTRFRWSGAGSLDPDSVLHWTGCGYVFPTGPLVDGLQVRVRSHGNEAGTCSTVVRVRARATGASIGFTVAATVLDEPIDSIFAARWYSRSALVGTTVRDTFLLVNRGSNPIRIDSARPTASAFQLATSLAGAVIQPGGSRQVVVSFVSASAAPQKARLRIHSAAFPWADTSVSLEGLAYPSGSVPLEPVARIDSISPRVVDWGADFSVIGEAWDADGLGVGNPVAAYEWVIGRDTLRGAGIPSYPSTRLSLGRNRISFRVRDNDGTWSPIATDTVVVRGMPPRIDSVRASKGVVLRLDGPLELVAVAHDSDQGAVAGSSYDGIAEVVWRSDLEGALGVGARLSVPASWLRVGVHSIWATVVDDDGDTTISDTLRVPVQASIGLAVLVAGTSFGDWSYFQGNIAPNANWIYQTLRSRGFSDEQIWYANRVGWQSLGDPFSDARIVDETSVTKAALRARILASRAAVEAGTPLVVALVGHGDASEMDGGRFFLNDSEWVAPWELNDWLGEFSGIDTTGRIVVLLDFCQSGAFQGALRAGFDRHRVVVSSADAANAAYFVRGKGFSQVFFAGIRKGRSVARSFEDARSWSDLAAGAGAKAGPLLNADMDGVYGSAADLAAAGSVWIGGSQQSQDPEPWIDSAWIAASSAAVFAKLSGTASRAWVEYRLGSDEPDSAPRVLALRQEASGDGIWQTAWPEGAVASDLSVHASSGAGALAFPWVLDGSALGRGTALRRERRPYFDRARGAIVLARRIGAGQRVTVDALDVAGRRSSRVEAVADATGWVEVAWAPSRRGLLLVRAAWPSGVEVSRVVVPEVR